MATRILTPSPLLEGEECDDPRLGTCFDHALPRVWHLCRVAVSTPSGGASHDIPWVELTQIEDISETTALVIMSELGTDLSAFAHEKNFVSWLGLCPQHRGSGGKIFKRRIRRGANRVARALRMSAQGCHHAKNALGAFYRRIQARAGGPKAIVATARKIAERVYCILKFGQDYVRQSQDMYEKAYQHRLHKTLAKKATSLGYKLEPETTTP